MKSMYHPYLKNIEKIKKPTNEKNETFAIETATDALAGVGLFSSGRAFGGTKVGSCPIVSSSTVYFVEIPAKTPGKRPEHG